MNGLSPNATFRGSAESIRQAIEVVQHLPREHLAAWPWIAFAMRSPPWWGADL